MKFRANFNTAVLVLFFFLGCFFVGNQVLIHSIGETFAMSDIQFSLMMTGFYAGSLISVLLIGEYAEKKGKRQEADRPSG